MENEKTKLLKIYLGEADKVYFRPLYEAIVLGAKRFGLNGSTVTRGVMAYGENTIVHSSKILTLSDDMPIIIEFIDSEKNLSEYAKIIEKLFLKANANGLITIQDIEIVGCCKRKK